MKVNFSILLGACLCFASLHNLHAAEAPPRLVNPTSLFDGKTLDGWEGNPKIWRVENGCLTGGSHSEMVKENEFLATTRNFTNFIIRFQIKLTGKEGFINSGFQIRSQRVPNNSEMAGYQCDYGEPNWYGAVYDESRRNKLMAASDIAALRPVLQPDSWNEYVIRADGSRITTWINGVLGVDYYEPDMSLPDFDRGRLGIQVHGGGKAMVQVKDIFIQELPQSPAFVGAKNPVSAGKPSPLTPQEELATFSLPPDFKIELIAAEDIAAGCGKFVAVDWDQKGRLWTMTALEYPVDANESPELARELYASRARDKALVFDRDPNSPTGYATTPRVFADGLAIPLGILPYKNGIYIQHGPDIVYWSDTDGDGRGDKRQVILSGFGVQDSHLFPHQFTRAPGNWLWMAQGAFNYGKVKTTGGEEVQFDQTRMARFRADGLTFEITSQGPCNIWGLVLDGNGQAWIQEANDFGYPMMPFHELANYPGCSGAQWKSYAPDFPPTAPEFAMGGTGLSGLALSDKVWPGPFGGIFYIANPITRKIQAIRVTPDGPRWRYQKLPDFLLSSDEWFRPVALRMGLDGCMYIVDWYNKIISHNEVPRNHPERDKKRGRIWRVSPKEMRPFAAPDFTTASGQELIALLGNPPLQQSHFAWQAITDRSMTELVPALKKILNDGNSATPRRIAALWALEGLKQIDRKNILPLLNDPDRNIRREAARVYGEHLPDQIKDLGSLTEDNDPEVRAQVIRSAALTLRGSGATGHDSESLRLIVTMAREPIDQPMMKSTFNGKQIKAGAAYEREFERYLARLSLEGHDEKVLAFLNSEEGRRFALEKRLLATLALRPETSASAVAKLLHDLRRPPGDEELLRLAQFPEQPGVGEALQSILRNVQTRNLALEGLLRVRAKLDAARIAPLLTRAAGELLNQKDPTSINLGVKLASGFALAGAEGDLAGLLEKEVAAKTQASGLALSEGSLEALRALRALRSDRLDLFTKIAQTGDAPARRAAISALAASRNSRGPEKLAAIASELPPLDRRLAFNELAASKSGARELVRAINKGDLPRAEVEGPVFDKLQASLGNDPELSNLMGEMSSLFRNVLRLDGSGEAWTETGLTLTGPFTVETWVKLDAGIDNSDGILGSPGQVDMNFFDSRIRVWVGEGLHDVVIASKKMAPESWTHLAITRDTQSRFTIFINGEADPAQSKPAEQKFENVRIGWTAPARGTAGYLSEFRIWNKARKPEEIRADFDRVFASDEMPPGLIAHFSGDKWGRLHSGARIVKTQDFPPSITSEEAKALASKFERFRKLAASPGNTVKGEAVFATACQSCHAVHGKGGQVGPVLNGAGALGAEALLRNIITPSAAMEAGYRIYRVVLKDGEILDGIRVSEDQDAIVLRRPSTEDLRIPQSTIRTAGFTRLSMMPEGLLDALESQQVSDLFAYLLTLR